MALTVFGVVVGLHGKRFGGFYKHVDSLELKIWVPELLQSSFLKDVSNQISVQKRSREALDTLDYPPP